MIRRFAKISYTSSRYIIARSCSGYGDAGGMVSYSGGQAISTGQGGFYGSGGTRASGADTTHNPSAVARNADVESLTAIMEDVMKMEVELDNLGTSVNSKTIELKNKIRKTISNPTVQELLDRLEIKGEPVW
eukprot:CAMPEP_0182417998 /NCGR_PEP_ID=MMETSP1167-20130531/2454_1 /TAXON_ID=2988 /ORGANISM="Mallomonas Sp, Strain CCMP3275" /LENGTH=131 /DNA_ID=CAMNT_0024591935 /DNA_START=112 /DNA_END=504 /DNA_ORIENTATION=+